MCRWTYKATEHAKARNKSQYTTTGHTLSSRVSVTASTTDMSKRYQRPKTNAATAKRSNRCLPPDGALSASQFGPPPLPRVTRWTSCSIRSRSPFFAPIAKGCNEEGRAVLPSPSHVLFLFLDRNLARGYGVLVLYLILNMDNDYGVFGLYVSE